MKEILVLISYEYIKSFFDIKQWLNFKGGVYAQYFDNKLSNGDNQNIMIFGEVV